MSGRDLHSVIAFVTAAILVWSAAGAAEPVACVEAKADRLVMYAAPGWYYELRVAPRFIRRRDEHYVLHLELPGRNFLPPELAARGVLEPTSRRLVADARPRQNGRGQWSIAPTNWHLIRRRKTSKLTAPHIYLRQ